MAKKKKIQHVDYRENMKIVTANDFITALGLEGISLKARKMLYLAISQCRQADKQFYEYRISALEFANIMEVSASHVYEEADSITDELMHGFLKNRTEGGFKKYALFSKCEYVNNDLVFKLNPDMTNFLLDIKGSFSQPLLTDFMKMNSPKSMAIWHLMQREMHSKKPYANNEVIFELSLDELREVTKTEHTFKQIGEFKKDVLNKALREIKDNCGVVITYTPVKRSRTIIGFRFIAKSQHAVKLPKEKQDKVDLFLLKQESKVRELTDEEKEKYDKLTANAEQMEMF